MVVCEAVTSGDGGCGIDEGGYFWWVSKVIKFMYNAENNTKQLRVHATNKDPCLHIKGNILWTRKPT